MSRRLLHRVLPAARRPDELLDHREQIAGIPTAWVERLARPEASEIPLVLVPGVSMSWRAYVWVLEALPRDRRVLVVDPPGAGRSGSPRGRLSADVQAKHLDAWLDHVGLNEVDVVGHSLGAVTAARLAARRPGAVRSVTLVSPSPDRRWPHFLSHVAALVRGVPEEAPRVLVQAAWDYVRASPRVLRGFASEMCRPASSVMAGVEARVLVVRGSEDRVSSDQWCIDLASAGGGQVCTIPEGAHGLPQQHPRELVEAITGIARAA